MRSQGAIYKAWQKGDEDRRTGKKTPEPPKGKGSLRKEQKAAYLNGFYGKGIQ